MPIALGAVEAWSELVVVLGAAVLSLTLCLRLLLDSNFRLTGSWTYLPLGLILGLILFQIAPLPTGLVGWLSPKNVELREELLGAEAAEAGQTGTLSLYPYATAHDLRMALVFVTLFVTSASVFRTSRQITRMLLIVFILGCIEASVGLLQILTFSEQILWMFEGRGRVVTSGSFINYSHFCQFLNLSLGAGIALLVVRMTEEKREGHSQSGGSSRNAWDRYHRLLVGVVLCAVAVLISMSRNGAISLFVASAVVGVLLYSRGTLSTRGWLLGMAPWCVLCILFLTCFDTVYERLATLEDSRHLDQRLEMTTGTLRAWQDFPVWGAGLKTHEYVFPLYDTEVTTSVAEHADNDWAQLLEEFGLVGTVAVLTFVVSIFCVAWKLMFRGRSKLSTAAFGLIVGLIATAIHSLSDFGQHVPAVFSLTAVVSGLLVAIARYEKRKTVSSRPGYLERQFENPARRRLAVGAALVGLGLVWWWAGTHSLAAHRGESWRAVADTLAGRLQKYDWQAENQDFVDLLAAAEHAAEAEPKNVRHGYLLNYYRWRSISRTLDTETGQLLLHPDVVPFVAQIVDELAQVRSLCSTYGPPFGLEGELRLLVLKEPEGERLIRLAAKLSPFHAPSCLLAGQLAAQKGSVEEASALLDRAVQLDLRHFGTVVQAYLFQLQRSDLAEALADDHGKLTQLAQLLDESDPPIDEYTRLAERLRATALKRLRERMEIGEASAGDLAHLAGVEARDENYKAAIGLYRRALVLDYDKNSWRMALARALVKVGETDQAMREARICLRLHPGSQAATQLIGELSVLP